MASAATSSTAPPFFHTDTQHISIRFITEITIIVFNGACS